MLRRLVYPCVVVLLPFLMYLQVWHGAAEQRLYFNGDFTDSYYPDLRVIELALFDGELPLWNPYDRAGYPFAADPQPGVLYPLNWVLAVIGHVMGGVSLGLTQFKGLLHLSIAGLGMFLFMRDRKQPQPAAVAAAVSYQFGAYFTAQVVFSLNWPLAWTPWLLRALDRLFARPTPLTAIAAASFVGLSVNAGSPPATFYGGLIALPYFVLRLVESLRAASLQSWLASTRRQLLLAGALGAIYAAPQLIATMALTKHSVLEKATYEHASSGSLIPEELLSLAVRTLGPNHYAGICALFLACLGALYWRERKEVGLFLGVIVVGMFLMLGVNTLVFRLAYDLIPGIDRFRLCFRYVILVSFGVSVLASYGVSALLERAVPRHALKTFASAALLLLGFGLYLQSLRPEAIRDPWLTRDLMTIGILLAFAVVLARGIADSARSGSLWCAGLLALMTLDYSAFLARAGITHPYTPYRDLLSTSEREQLRKDVRGYRVFNQFPLDTIRAGSLDRFRDFNGYIDPLVLERFSNVMFEQLRYHPAQIMGLLNVKYYLHSPHAFIGFDRHFVPDPDHTPGLTRIAHRIYEVADPAPDAYWVGHIDLKPNQASVMSELDRVDYHKTAFVADDTLSDAQRAWALALPASTHASVAARVLTRGFNYTSFSVKAPADGLLVINEAWFPGWVAHVDGDATPLLEVNGMMQGLHVTPGEHHVELRFRPYSYLVPMWLALLSLLASAVYFARAQLNRAALP